MRSISIDLTTLMTEILQEIIRSRLPGIAVIERARCILLAHGKIKYVEISQAVQLSAKAVGRWVHRFADSLEALRHVEKTGVRAALTRAIIDCLRDAPRSGAPKKFTPAEVICMISIACEDPEKSNRPVTSWTAREIASEAVLRNIVTAVSISQVQRFLNQVQLRPHKKKGWCFTTEKDQELFQSQAEAVCNTYLPKHSSWLNQVEVVFGMFNRRVMRSGNFTSKANLISKLQRFTAYFNATIAKPMTWAFTGRPTEQEAVESPKTWRQLWPFRHLLATIETLDRT